jgi:hypothetical protein
MPALQLAAHQHQEIRRRLRAEDPHLDEQTLADTVEGLTDLHAMLAAVIRAALLDEALACGLRARIEEMEERLRRFDERALKRRQIVRDVMVESEIKKLMDPEFTVSIRAGSPALVVVDEAAIPAGFWEPREPRLNRMGLLGALKRGGEIAGVALSNPEPVLSVRTR